MKIYLSKINESWIIDRIREEWYLNNKDISTKSLNRANVVWIIAPWVWKKLPSKKLLNKKVVCSIYHINEKQFNNEDFKKLEYYVDFFHVISENTKKTLRNLTNKPIYKIPLWIDSKKFFYIKNKVELREKYDIPPASYVVGSFQRDTEGSDLKSPKLIKGPDIFVNIVHKISLQNSNLLVLLAGKRRNYVINELNKLGINYKYLEMVSISKLNELYNLLDLYIVSSRLEGGPQAIVECGITKTPIISTNVGIAPEILHSDSIYEVDNYFDAEPNTLYAYNNVQKLLIPEGMDQFRKLFNHVSKN